MVVAQLIAYATPNTLALTGFGILLLELLKKTLGSSYSSIFVGLAFGGIVFAGQLLFVISRHKPERLKDQWDRWVQAELIDRSHQKMLNYAISLTANPGQVLTDKSLQTLQVPVSSIKPGSAFCQLRVDAREKIGTKFSYLILRVPMTTKRISAEVLGLRNDGNSVPLSDLDPVAFAEVRKERAKLAKESPAASENVQKGVAAEVRIDLISFGSRQALGKQKTRNA